MQRRGQIEGYREGCFGVGLAVEGNRYGVYFGTRRGLGANEEHGGGYAPEHKLGNTTPQGSLETAATVGAEGNQARLKLEGMVGDALSYVLLFGAVDMAGYGYRGAKASREACQVAFGPGYVAQVGLAVHGVGGLLLNDVQQ